jgi:hypothetical protein
MTTQTIKAWLTYPQVAEPGDECNPEKLTFTNLDMADAGWLEVGYAEINLTTTFSREQLVQSMVSTLQEQIRKERAESHQRISEFERKINDLLLITHEAQS